MSKKLIVGNFKMNLLYEDIKMYIDNVKKCNFTNVIYCPSYIYLHEFVNNGLAVGAQDLSPYENGAHTGDVSASQLKSIGVNYAIIGHSERRRDYQEKAILLEKVKQAVKEGIVPIYCIGETKEEYDNSLTLNTVKKEIDYIFSLDINLENLIIAYEPLWAIGTGLIPANSEIYMVIEFIKQYVFDKYHYDIKVLYGGSINTKNIKELERINNIDGYLIGGSSIKANDFIDIIGNVNNYE